MLAASGLARRGGGVLIALLGEGKKPASGPAAGSGGGKVGWALRSGERPSGRPALAYFGHMWELYAFWSPAPGLAGVALGDCDPGGRLPGGAIRRDRGGGGRVLSLGGRLVPPPRHAVRVAAAALAVSAGRACLAPLLPGLWPGGGPGPRRAAARVGVRGGGGGTRSSSRPCRRRACPADAVGSGLAVQNGVGFPLITVAAIQLTVGGVAGPLGPWVGWVLLPGPLLGLAAMARDLRPRPVVTAAEV